MRIDPPISPWEVYVLRTLCREFRVYHAEKDKPEKKSIADSLSEIAEINKSKARTQTPKKK